MPRKKCQVKKCIKLLVEGNIEKNYFNGLKNSKNLYFSIKTVDMHGGGYSNFLRVLKKRKQFGLYCDFYFY